MGKKQSEHRRIAAGKKLAAPRHEEHHTHAVSKSREQDYDLPDVKKTAPKPFMSGISSFGHGFMPPKQEGLELYDHWTDRIGRAIPYPAYRAWYMVRYSPARHARTNKLAVHPDKLLRDYNRYYVEPPPLPWSDNVRHAYTLRVRDYIAVKGVVRFHNPKYESGDALPAVGTKLGLGERGYVVRSQINGSNGEATGTDDLQPGCVSAPPPMLFLSITGFAYMWCPVGSMYLLCRSNPDGSVTEDIDTAPLHTAPTDLIARIHVLHSQLNGNNGEWTNGDDLAARAPRAPRPAQERAPARAPNRRDVGGIDDANAQMAPDREQRNFVAVLCPCGRGFRIPQREVDWRAQRNLALHRMCPGCREAALLAAPAPAPRVRAGGGRVVGAIPAAAAPAPPPPVVGAIPAAAAPAPPPPAPAALARPRAPIAPAAPLAPPLAAAPVAVPAVAIDALNAQLQLVVAQVARLEQLAHEFPRNPQPMPANVFGPLLYLANFAAWCAAATFAVATAPFRFAAYLAWLPFRVVDYLVRAVGAAPGLALRWIWRAWRAPAIAAVVPAPGAGAVPPIAVNIEVVNEELGVGVPLPGALLPVAPLEAPQQVGNVAGLVPAPVVAAADPDADDDGEFAWVYFEHDGYWWSAPSNWECIDSWGWRYVIYVTFLSLMYFFIASLFSGVMWPSILFWCYWVRQKWRVRFVAELNEPERYGHTQADVMRELGYTHRMPTLIRQETVEAHVAKFAGVTTEFKEVIRNMRTTAVKDGVDRYDLPHLAHQQVQRMQFFDRLTRTAPERKEKPIADVLNGVARVDTVPSRSSSWIPSAILILILSITIVFAQSPDSLESKQEPSQSFRRPLHAPDTARTSGHASFTRASHTDAPPTTYSTPSYDFFMTKLTSGDYSHYSGQPYSSTPAEPTTVGVYAKRLQSSYETAPTRLASAV